MTQYKRVNTIIVRELDDSCYLINPIDDSIFQTNLLGKSIWHLLKSTISSDEIIETLSIAFPDISTDVITNDVEILLSRLLEKRLITQI